MAYVGRFAPSPTGPLHLGSLVAALGSFLDARAQQGRWLLRIEDLDTARVRPGCADDMLRTLEGLGLHWDGPVVYQSRRLPLYAAALQTLALSGDTFECYCTRRERSGTDEARCSGDCRTRSASAPATVRFAVRQTDAVTFDDRFQGACSFATEEFDDVVVRRRDQVIAYQLAVVVDDAAQAITDVVRGADLLPSTAWQILLQRALQLPTPRYAHLPVVVEPDGSKLAKSRRSLAVDPRAGGRELAAALQLLRQTPCKELWQESAQTVLSWALQHWQPANLERVQIATIPIMTP